MSYTTALIVDDSKLARIALKKKLEKRGLQIVMAEDAKQALDVLDGTAVDIVFMDHLMPEMDGFEATQKIKANQATAHVPVIMCSGKEKNGYLEEARAIGASNVLPKPAESEAIDAVFAELEQPVDMAVAAVSAEAEQAAGLSEADVHALLEPLHEQLKALGVQLDAQAEIAERRLAASEEAIRVLEKAAPQVEPFDQQQLQSDLSALLDQRLADLDLPEPDAMQLFIKKSVAELQDEKDQQWQDKLSAAIEAAKGEMDKSLQAAVAEASGAAPEMDELLSELEGRVSRGMEAVMTQMLEDRAEQLEASFQQQLQALQGDIPQAAAPLDIDVLKQELMAEWLAHSIAHPASGRHGEDVLDVLPAASNEAISDNGEDLVDLSTPDLSAIEPAVTPASGSQRGLWWVTAFSTITAMAAVAMHWL